MKYLRAVEVHEEHSRPCPHCGAPKGHWCVSDSGHVNTKSHTARINKPEHHTKLPDLKDWWREEGEKEKKQRQLGAKLRRRLEARGSRRSAIA